MLQKLNERIQGVVAWVVISLIAVTFALFGIDYYIQSHHDTSVQVEVNGQSITRQEVELSYRRARQQRDPSQITPASDSLLKKQILDDMILNKVSMKAARANGFEVNVAQADAAILGIPQFQEDGHFSADRYQQVLSSALFTHSTFLDEVRQGMLLNQQRFAFIGTAFALPSEIKRFVKLYLQTRDYDYLPIAADKFINQVKVTDDEIKHYYQQHQKEFLSEEKVSVDYIRLSTQDIKANINLADEQIKRFYDENQSNYLSPAQWQVASILFAVPENASTEERQKIKARADETYQLLKTNPELFEEKVSGLSDDKISARNKGILPWIVAGQSTFDKALLQLMTPGQLSAPVKSRYGYQLFKLLAYKPASVKPFSEVKDDIQAQLQAEIAQTNYANVLEQLSDLSYQTPDTLAPVADALNLPIKKSAFFGRRGGEDALTKNKSVVRAAFSHDVLELDNNSEPIQLDNDSVVVLRVNKHLPATVKSFAEVKTLITNKLARNKAEVLASQVGNQLLQASQNTSQQENLLQANHLQWQKVVNASREVDKAPEAVNHLAFNLPRAGESMGEKLANGDYVIVHLQRINDGKLKMLDKEQLASITQQIEANYGVMDYDLYVNGLLGKAKIVKH